jgi:flagellar biosynthesis/type III secretory pathway protein FliH
MAVLWLRFLKEVHEQNAQVSEELMENKDIRKAMDVCEKGGFTPKELALYEKYQDAIRTENAALETSMKEGEAKGLAEGKAEGEKEREELKQAIAEAQQEIAELKRLLSKK